MTIQENIYGTTDIDGVFYIGVEEGLTKGDFIYGIEDGDFLLFKVNVVNDDYPKLYKKYYFDDENFNNIVELRRTKYTDLDNSLEGKFKLNIITDNGVLNRVFNIRPSKNQTIVAGNKPYKVTNVSKTDEKNTLNIEVEPLEGYEVKFYYSRGNSKDNMKLYDSHFDFLMDSNYKYLKEVM